MQKQGFLDSNPEAFTFKAEYELKMLYIVFLGKISNAKTCHLAK